MVEGIVSWTARPKYQQTEAPDTSNRKSPRRVKTGLPTSTSIVVKLAIARSHFLALTGRQIEKSDEQPANAEYSILDSLEPDSNVRLWRAVQ
jgi:hypothetical protein